MSSEDRIDALPGLMMDVPLLVTGILRHAAKNHPHHEVVARDGDAILSYRYADVGERVAQLANALVRLEVAPGDRVAAFGWNTHRLFELSFAVPGLGAVLHVVDIRTPPEEIAATIAHADDRVIFVDESLVSEMRAAMNGDPSLGRRRFVIMGDGPERFRGAGDYEKLLAAELRWFSWPELDENSAALLKYTAASVDDPKGKLFSHRAIVLQALASTPADVFGLSRRDRVLPIAPMLHRDGWGVTYVAPLVGASLILPGARVAPDDLIELIDRESVNVLAGVSRLVIDPAVLGLRVIASPFPPTALVDWKILDESGRPVAADGFSRGELWLRGPTVARSYFNNAAASAQAIVDGWYRSGEIATLDASGSIEIIER